ncbi:MAG: serine hydrolase [Flavobacteriales bacterium]|nr:serine hydrolase [Flavobacteriales bacterium]
MNATPTSVRSLALLFCIPWITASFAQVTASVSASTDKVAKVDALMSTFAAYDQFTGAVLVAEKGKVIYKKAFGMADREWDVPNTTDTKFRLASITKQFTAMLIVQLVAEGKLALDVPIAQYLPDYPKVNAGRITLHHLLSHSSGTPNYTDFPNYREMMVQLHTTAHLMRLFADSTSAFTPGARFAYSNSGYMVLGAIVERITGMSYAQALQERIFTPLGMASSGVDNGRSVLKKRASGYDVSGSTVTNAYFIDMSTPFSAGAIYSIVEDLFLWDQALYTEKLLPKQYRDLMFQPHISTGGGSYGYGWGIGELGEGNGKEKSRMVSHSGGINGFNTLITRIPADSILVVLLNNTSNAPLSTMTLAINGILHDQPYDMPRKSLAKTISATMEKDGIEKAVAQFNALKSSKEQYLDESEMNMAGYELLWAGKKQEAAALLKLNVDVFPNSSNAYDSYGEALLALGDSANAIANYKRSIQLNPDNTNGIQVLEGLGIATDDLAIKIPLEKLQTLTGAYIATKETSNRDREWKIVIDEKDGQLYGNDADYRYKMVPTGDNTFVNPEDGTTLVFDTTKKKAISFVIFGKVVFKKVK